MEASLSAGSMPGMDWMVVREGASQYRPYHGTGTLSAGWSKVRKQDETEL